MSIFSRYTNALKNFSFNQERRLIKQQAFIISNDFDKDYYVKNYPEVLDLGIDPVLHFLTEGWQKGYDPNEDFSTSYYLEIYDDVRLKKVNPFVHYLEHGKKEGRQPQKGAETKSDIPEDETKTLIQREFDPVFYATTQLNRDKAHGDELDHFINVGWKNGLDPNPNFSVDFYLKTNHDIKLYGINPFYHYLKSGKKEGRNPVGLFHISKKSVFRPKVTAIVPNYNHEKFLEVRINSILNQTYKEIDIILLDDCSSDNSIEVLKSFEDKYPDRIKFVPNENNSGNVFRQWKKGLGLVKSEFVWICESDDAANPTFVESLIPYFLDRAVMIAFGKIQFITQEGKYMPGLDGFREGAKQGIWEDVQIRSAAEWFNGPFGIRNIIPNVGGCIFRNQTISEDVWKEAESYKVLGDWYLYSRLANGGNIAYDPTAVAYFRQHGKNTSVGSFTTDRYYDEHYRFMVQLKKMWNIKEETVDKFIEYTKWQYKHHFGQDKEEDFYKIFDVEDVRSTKKVRTHLLIGFLGFHVGGGELFPIQLASEIVKDDNFIVSMIALNRNNEVQEVIDQLDKRVSVYSADILKRKEINKFLDSAGIEIVNTHNVGMEFQFLIGNEVALNIPYTVTLHGSYEVANLSDSIIIELLKKVNHWIYTADRNLTHFEGIPLSPTALTKLSNAMAMTNVEFEFTRESLGISEDGFIFGLMARTIEDKGWEEGILATLRAAELSGKEVHLILVGSGGVQPELKKKYDFHNNIHFLGFQSNVHGFFRLCDCCLLPTKFRGESNPLVLIQSMQVDTPIVSVDVGEIKTMLIRDDMASGIVVPLDDDRGNFISSLSNAMVEMLDEENLVKYKEGAKTFGKGYSISKVANKYKNQLINILSNS